MFLAEISFCAVSGFFRWIFSSRYVAEGTGKGIKGQENEEKIKPEPPIGASVPRDGSILILSTCSVIGTYGPWDG